MELSSRIKLDKETIESPNLCEKFSNEDLEQIGNFVYENYDSDVRSRDKWEKRTKAAMDLAMQVQNAKSFPWPNCSNIAFPLITVAALQFHARAYPAIINGRKIVDCRVVGPDPEGLARERADRISQHMSWQLLEQDESWEEQMDRGLLNVSIVGCGFKKSYYDPGKGHNVSEFVSAHDLIVNYWAKSIETVPVKTHRIPLSKNDIYERCKRGTYRDVLSESWYQGVARPSETDASRAADNRAGTNRPTDNDETPFIVLEQHCSIDLDCDGYAEPYIVTIEESSKSILRIVTRFDRLEDIEFNEDKEVVKITPMEYFTKIPMLPSPDGGLLDVGFGVLIGPLNESVNSSINQLFDAGTLANTAGGFLGRGAKLKGGVYSFQPFGWQRVDATGDDLRKSIFPLPVREPSAVMFNLLSLLIDYTNRIAGATDMMVGENPGQNTPAETSRTMIEQGQKIYSAIFKRIWRSMKQEFKKLYTLNSIYLPDQVSFGENGTIRREDYSFGLMNVIPVADPTLASDGARFAQARMLKEAAAATPGYDGDEVERRYLHALGIDDSDKVFPGTAGQEPPVDVKVQIQAMKNEVAMAQLEKDKMMFIMTMQETVRMNTAKIAQLTAQAMKLEVEAESEPQRRNVEAFRAGIEAMREQNAQTNAHLDRLMEQFNDRDKSGGKGTVSGVEEPSSNSATDSLGIPKETDFDGVVG